MGYAKKQVKFNFVQQLIYQIEQTKM